MSAQPERTIVTSEVILNSIIETEEWAKKLQEDMIPLKQEELVYFLGNALACYHQLEAGAEVDPINIEAIRAIWIVSAPGTYFQRNKNDRYSDKEWSWWADRRRINHAFRIGRQIAEKNAGTKIVTNSPKDMELIRRFGPTLIYNGRFDENAAISEAVKIPWLRIPEGLGYPSEKVMIIYPQKEKFQTRFLSEQYNLLDQAQTLHLPYDLKLGNQDEIGIVAHASQGVRILYTLGRFNQSLPSGVKARMLMLPTPEQGIPEYIIQELRALVYYRFIDEKAPLAADSPYPYIL